MTKAMKVTRNKTLKNVIFLCFFTWVFFFMFLKNISAQTIHLKFACDDQHTFPFYMGNSRYFDAEKPGISIEVLKLLENKLNIKIRFERFPLKRCLLFLKKGVVDGFFNAGFVPERQKIGVYPMKGNAPDPRKRIATISYFFFKLRNSPMEWNPKSQKIENLSGDICIPFGYSIANDLKKIGIKAVARYHTFDCFELLSNAGGRFAAVAALEPSGDYYLKKYKIKFKNIVKLRPSLTKRPYFLMLSHQFVDKHPALSKKIWDGVESIRKKEYSTIKRKYVQ